MAYPFALRYRNFNRSVRFYAKGIADTNYTIPLLGMILTAAYAAECLRVPYFRMIKAAGRYKQTQTASIIEMLINVVFSVALVKRFA
ncbi:MAG: hypothetical protein V8T00_04770 [Oscillospiraceae bacterium]